MNITKLKYVCSSFTSNISTDLITDEKTEQSAYKIYGASGLLGFFRTYYSPKEYLGIIKDGAGVGRIKKYPAYTSILGTMAYIVPNDDINIDWLKYTISALSLEQSLDKTTIPHIYFSEYGNRNINYVPLPEQHRIADFLDHECEKIDGIIADIQSQIETLEQYKRSVITEAVTKGLNPNVEMKDSGIDYIGSTPKHWNKRRLKYILTERNERSLDGLEELLSVSQYYGVIPSSENKMRTMQAESLVGYKKVFVGDLVFNKLNPGLARFGESKYNGITSPDFAVYIPNDECNSMFLQYLLKCDKYVASYKGIGCGVGDGFARLYTPQLYNFYVSLPPIDELSKICKFIEQKCSQIDSIISDKQNQIETLESYKKSLIYEYVTGKKEVPNE